MLLFAHITAAVAAVAPRPCGHPGCVRQAALKFISHHAHLFHASIAAAPRDTFDRVLACVYSKHRRVSLYASDAAAAVLVQVSAALTATPPPGDGRAVFGDFLRLFVAMMEGEQVVEGPRTSFPLLDSMRLGMKGCGIFAGACAAYMGQGTLRV